MPGKTLTRLRYDRSREAADVLPRCPHTWGGLYVSQSRPCPLTGRQHRCDGLRDHEGAHVCRCGRVKAAAS